MGNLIVKNGTAVMVIDTIEVTQKGQTVVKQTGLNIPSGGTYSIPLQPGVYDATVTFRDPGGKTIQETKQVAITQEEDYILEIYQVPEETKTSVPPNLTQG